MDRIALNCTSARVGLPAFSGPLTEECELYLVTTTRSGEVDMYSHRGA